MTYSNTNCIILQQCSCQGTLNDKTLDIFELILCNCKRPVSVPVIKSPAHAENEWSIGSQLMSVILGDQIVIGRRRLSAEAPSANVKSSVRCTATSATSRNLFANQFNVVLSSRTRV